jgi:hypothetical protein
MSTYRRLVTQAQIMCYGGEGLELGTWGGSEGLFKVSH